MYEGEVGGQVGGLIEAVGVVEVWEVLRRVSRSEIPFELRPRVARSCRGLQRQRQSGGSGLVVARQNFTLGVNRWCMGAWQ